MAAALLLSTALLGGTGCNRTSGTSAAKDDLHMVPKETDVVFMVNVKQVRKSPLWEKFVEKLNQDPTSKANVDDLVKKCQIDPFKQVDSLFVAVPSNVTDSKEFALILRGGFLPEKFVSCLQTVAKEKGEPVSESDYNGHKIYTIGKQSSYMTAIGKKGVVLAGADWVKRAIDLDAGKGENATKNSALVDMIKRTKTSDSLWWAGLVPPQTSEKLSGNPQLGPVRSLRSVSGSIELAKGLDLHAFLDLGSDGDAVQLKDKATEQLTQLRSQPSLKMMGLSGFLDTVKVSAQKSSFVLDVNMNQQQVDDLITRLSGLAQMR
jgi:hypothetical protein